MRSVSASPCTTASPLATQRLTPSRDNSMPRPSMPWLSNSRSRSPSPQPTSSTFEALSTILATSRWSPRYSTLPASGATPLSGKVCCWATISAPLFGQAARTAGRLQERARNIDELGHVEQERVVAAIGLDLGERYPRAGGVERVDQRPRFRGRKQPVGGKRHHAKPGLDAAERFRQHAFMVGGD